MPQSQEEYERINRKYKHRHPPGYPKGDFIAGKQVELCFNCIHWTHPSMNTGCELGRCPVSLTEEYCTDREVKE